jgi:hypothetical protein
MPASHHRTKIPFPPDAVPRFSIIDGIAALCCIGLALWVYRAVLGGFFSPDDLVLWEWDRGMIPGPTTLWRYLPGRLYFGLTIGTFGASPYPYFLINWLFHGINVALIYILVRRLGGGSLAATLAAGLFGTSRLFLTAVGQAVGFGDLLALCFTLLACIAMTFRAQWTVVAGTLVFLLALLSKEIVVALPLSLLLAPAVGPSLAARVRRLAPLFVVGVLWIAYLGQSGARGSVLGGTAYSTAFGRNLSDSVLMYAQWSATCMASPRTLEQSAQVTHGSVAYGFSSPSFSSPGWSDRRSRLPLVGLTWWLAGLAPILPLVFQKHLHYLYSPSVGFALWIGSVAEVLLQTWARLKGWKRGRMYAAWMVVMLLLPGHAALSDSLIRKRYQERLADVDLPADTFVRKMEIARRATSSVRAAIGDRPARVVFYNPLIRGKVDFYAQLLPAMLDQGRGLRALYPNIDSVVFVPRWTPDFADFEIVVANEDGRVLPFGRGPAANVRLIQTLEGNGYAREAAELLQSSVAAYPNDPALQAMFSTYRARAR